MVKSIFRTCSWSKYLVADLGGVSRPVIKGSQKIKVAQDKPSEKKWTKQLSDGRPFKKKRTNNNKNNY